jgi:F-type H+-transporting ATPase subunit epsilon
VSLLAALDVWVLRVRDTNGWQSIALMGGFAEVEADEVTVLVNSAELGSCINASEAEAELEQARATVTRMEGQSPSPEKVKAQQTLDRARARVQAAK